MKSWSKEGKCPAVKLIAVLLCVMMLTGFIRVPACAEESAEAAALTYEITQAKYPTYFYNLRFKADEDIPLYFVDGAEDFPFVDLRDWRDILNYVFDGLPGYYGYKIAATVDDGDTGIVTLQRENGSTMTCNFADGEIVFDDYNAFNQNNNGLYMNIIGGNVKNTPDQVDVLGVTSSRERRGKVITLNLRDYGIPMIAQDGKYLAPLQTLSYLTLSSIQYNGFFNRKELYITSVSRINTLESELIKALREHEFMSRELWQEAGEKTNSPSERIAYVLEVVSRDEKGREFIEFEKDKLSGTLSDLYYSGPRGERSEALAGYGYNELCMELDHEYGLKDAHNITGFAEYFEQTGLTARLLDLDAAVADNAIGELTRFWLDDGHSGFLSNSYLTGYAEEAGEKGYSIQRLGSLGREIEEIRKKYENAREPYYEVGNTAYITFDEFFTDSSVEQFSDYYRLDEEDGLPDDTVGLLIEAHRKITRENSPIRNVVLDLSCNGGGEACAGAFALCWFLGEAQVSAVDSLTGAESTVSFKADVNLDHQYDEKDSLSNLNLYCLISPQSFSCANLVTWAFKADGRVTLLGKTSGGGSCVVRQLTTAWGSSYQISCSQRMSFVKNGSYYDVDRGADPDFYIRDYNNYYDREALTEIINGIR